MFKTKILYAVVSFALMLGVFYSLVGANVASAQTAPVAPARQEYTGGGLVNCGHSIKDPCRVQDLFIMVARVTNYLIGMAGLYAIVWIIYSGFGMVISAGNEEVITQKKGAITNAIIGLVLTLIAFLLITTVGNVVLLSKCKIDLTHPLNYLDQKCS